MQQKKASQKDSNLKYRSSQLTVAEKILLADSVRPESPEDIVMTITVYE